MGLGSVTRSTASISARVTWFCRSRTPAASSGVSIIQSSQMRSSGPGRPAVLEDQVFVSHAGLPGPEERIWEDWMMETPDEAAGVLLRQNQVTLADIEAVDRVTEPNPM